MKKYIIVFIQRFMLEEKNISGFWELGLLWIKCFIENVSIWTDSVAC